MNSFNSYIPGQAYKEGYNDRMNGFADRSLSQESIDLYWGEYRQGYAQADRVITEKARKGIVEGRTFLTENRWVQGKDE